MNEYYTRACNFYYGTISKTYIREKKSIPLDQFISISLYDKKFGYYMKNNPFGKEGDFITSPLVSNLFGEMLAVWCVAFWEQFVIIPCYHDRHQDRHRHHQPPSSSSSWPPLHPHNGSSGGPPCPSSK